MFGAFVASRGRVFSHTSMHLATSLHATSATRTINLICHISHTDNKLNTGSFFCPFRDSSWVFLGHLKSRGIVVLSVRAVDPFLRLNGSLMLKFDNKIENSLIFRAFTSSYKSNQKKRKKRSTASSSMWIIKDWIRNDLELNLNSTVLALQDIYISSMWFELASSAPMSGA